MTLLIYENRNSQIAQTSIQNSEFRYEILNRMFLQ